MRRLARPPRLEDRQLHTHLEDTTEVVRSLQSVALLDGRLVKDVTITVSVTKELQHKLGRAPVGYLVVKRSANAVVWDSAADDPKVELWLNASATVTVDLWVF